MGYLKRLQHKWKLESRQDVFIVLIVFASTGFTIMFLKGFLLSFLDGGLADSKWVSILYYVFILPIYNIVLLFYGLIFGRFKFFWDFEVRMWNRMTGKKANEESQ